jgi:hypothetical protein
MTLLPHPSDSCRPRINRPICQYKPTSSAFTARAACTRDVRTRTLTCSSRSAYPAGSTAPDLAGVLTRPSSPDPY